MHGSTTAMRLALLALAVLPGMAVWIELKSLPRSADHSLLDAIDRSPNPERCAVHGFDHLKALTLQRAPRDAA